MDSLDGAIRRYCSIWVKHYSRDWDLRYASNLKIVKSDLNLILYWYQIYQACQSIWGKICYQSQLKQNKTQNIHCMMII